MKFRIEVIIAVLLVLFLTGCVDTSTIVKVNRDGSGTIEETVIISLGFLQLMQGMSGEAAEPAEAIDMLDEDELKEKAGQIGEGVALVSAESIKTDSGTGYKAIYSFKDINKIRINQNPAENVPTRGPGGPDAEETGEFITFSFKKGSTSTLNIFKPREELAAEKGQANENTAGATDPAADPGMLEMMRQIYQDMRISMAVEVKGSIIDTNALYREGSRITIMELDFAKLLENEEQFQKLARANPDTLEETKELFKDIPGMKVELQDTLKITFR